VYAARARSKDSEKLVELEIMEGLRGRARDVVQDMRITDTEKGKRGCAEPPRFGGRRASASADCGPRGLAARGGVAGRQRETRIAARIQPAERSNRRGPGETGAPFPLKLLSAAAVDGAEAAPAICRLKGGASGPSDIAMIRRRTSAASTSEWAELFAHPARPLPPVPESPESRPEAKVKVANGEAKARQSQLVATRRGVEMDGVVGQEGAGMCIAVGLAEGAQSAGSEVWRPRVAGEPGKLVIEPAVELSKRGSSAEPRILPVSFLDGLGGAAASIARAGIAIAGCSSSETDQRGQAGAALALAWSGWDSRRPRLNWSSRGKSALVPPGVIVEPEASYNLISPLEVELGQNIAEASFRGSTAELEVKDLLGETVEFSQDPVRETSSGSEMAEVSRAIAGKSGRAGPAHLRQKAVSAPLGHRTRATLFRRSKVMRLHSSQAYWSELEPLDLAG
ncbi:unnamed protein product, partial [Prorocentrum cordatum]